MRVADAGDFSAGGLAGGFGSGSFVDFGGRGRPDKPGSADSEGG